jgi:hypothetical protein
MMQIAVGNAPIWICVCWKGYDSCMYDPGVSCGAGGEGLLVYKCY